MFNAGQVYLFAFFTILMDEMLPNETVVARWGTLLIAGRLVWTHRSQGALMYHLALPSEYVKSGLGGMLITNNEMSMKQKHQKNLMRKTN